MSEIINGNGYTINMETKTLNLTPNSHLKSKEEVYAEMCKDGHKQLADLIMPGIKTYASQSAKDADIVTGNTVEVKVN